MRHNSLKKWLRFNARGVTHFSPNFIGSVLLIHRPFPRAINHPDPNENEVFPASYR